MKQTVTESDFRDAFRAMESYEEDRRTDQFSYEGLGVLFDYLAGEELELDVIALCCDYYEDTWENIAENYGIELTDPEDEDLVQEEVQEYLEQNTALVGTVTGGCIYQAF